MPGLEDVLKVVSTGASLAASFALPGPAGFVVNLINSVVRTMEDAGKIWTIPGEQKKQGAVAVVGDVLNIVQAASGKSLNTSEAMQRISQMIDDAVWLANFVGEFKK